MSYAAIIQVIAGAITAANERARERRIEEWRGTVSASLNTIIAQNAEILRGLALLRLTIEEEIIEGFRNNDLGTFNGILETFDIYLQDVRGNVDNGSFVILLNDAQIATLKLPRHGSAVFPAFYAGIMLLLALYRILGKHRRERAKLIATALDTLRSWTVMYPGSIRAAISEAKSDKASCERRMRSVEGKRVISKHNSTRRIVTRRPEPSDVAIPCSSDVVARTSINSNLDVRIEDVHLSSPNCSFEFDEREFRRNHQRFVERMVAEFKRSSDNLEDLESFYQLLVECIDNLEEQEGTTSRVSPDGSD